ncbi:MAG: luciferase family protein [Ignavibacteriaceae bacterium]
MPVQGALEKIKNSVTKWKDITSHQHRFGGIEFRLDKREIGHIHGNYLVDIPFTKKIKNEILSAGLASLHHVLPESGWISKYLKEPGDVDTAIELLKRSYDSALKQKSKRILNN